MFRKVLFVVFVVSFLAACSSPVAHAAPLTELVYVPVQPTQIQVPTQTQMPTQTIIPTLTYQSPSGVLIEGQTVSAYLVERLGPGWCNPVQLRTDGIWDTGDTQHIAVLVDNGVSTVFTNGGNAWFWAQEIVPSTKLLNREGVNVSYDAEYIISDRVSDFVRLGVDFTSITYQPYWGDEYIRVVTFSAGKLELSQWYQVFGTCTENVYFKMSGSPGSP